MEAKLPIILFDTKKNQLPKDNVIDSQTYYIYSFQNFGIKIIGFEYFDVTSNKIITIKNDYPEWDSILADSAETIFSAKLNPTENKVVIDSQKSYPPVNFGYTLFISQNLTKVWYELTSINGDIVIYTFQQKLSNIIDESNAHYLDLIINKYLPTTEELLPALFLGDTGAEDFSNREILKRLLLDFRNILKHKGTKRSIELFFNFVGINNLMVFEEWLKYGKSGIRETTLTPDTKSDTKTGNYYVEYYNWEKTDELDEYNLPVRKLSVEDLDKFFDTLKRAIALANTYFTLLEQEIVFFGLVYNSNNPIQQNLTSIHNVIFRINPYEFRRKIILDVWQNSQGHIHQDTNQYKKYLLDNLVQINDMFYRSEIKIKRNAGVWDKNIFWVDSEISDLDSENPDELDTIFSVFGECMNLLFTNNYDQELTFELDIKGLDNANISDTGVFTISPGAETTAFYVHKDAGLYELTIRISDGYRNRETYIYRYMITDDYSKLDFDVYTSKNMIELNQTGINDITTEIDSPSLISTPIDINYLNYILAMIDTPSNILEYYHKDPSINPVRWLTDNPNQYIIPNISIYDIVNDISDTIPLELSEQWVELCTYPYSDNYKLMIRWFDAEDCTYKLIDYSDIQKMNVDDNVYGTLNGIDKLFVTVLDIIEQGIDSEGNVIPITNETPRVPYMFVMSTETGLDLNTWDFVLVHNSLLVMLPNDLKSTTWSSVDCFQESIIELSKFTDVQKTKIPVNHDYPLFLRNSALVPGFKHYISPDVPTINIPDSDGTINQYPLMKSMFMRLMNLMDSESNDGIDLKLADVIVAKLNRDFITEEINISWSIVNTFTGEVFHATSDLSLKYRISDNTIYTIRLDININGKIFQIYRPSIISSFKKTTLLEN